MTNKIDWFLVNWRDQSFQANSLGAQTVQAVKEEQATEKQRATNERIDGLISENALLDKGIKKDDYNFSAMLEEQGAFSSSPDGLTLPNKYRSPLKHSVMGFDLGTGRQELKLIKDKDGIAKKGAELLQASYTNSTAGRPSEDAFPLSQIAYQALRENKTFEEFKRGAPDWDDQTVTRAWNAAQTVDTAEQYQEYVKGGEWNTRDNPPRELPEKFKHDEIATNDIWVNSSKVVLEKLYGKAKAGTGNEEVNKAALLLMSQFNNNLSAQSMLAARVADSEDEDLKKAFYNMMLFYDNIDISGARSEYFGRAVGSVVSDPLAYIGAGVGAMLYKKLAGAQVGSRALSPILAASISAAPEGAFYSLGLEAGKQTAEKEAGARAEYDAGQMLEEGAKGAALAAGGTAALGGLIKGAGNSTNAILNRVNEIRQQEGFFSGPSFMKAQEGSILVGDGQGDLLPYMPDADPFYYQTEKVISESFGNKPVTGAQALEKIKAMARRGKIKKDELEFSGLAAELEARSGEKFTRDELLTLAKENAFTLERKVLSGEADEPTQREINLYDDYDTRSPSLLREAEDDYITAIADGIVSDVESHGFSDEVAIARILEDDPALVAEDLAFALDDEREKFAMHLAREIYEQRPFHGFGNDEFDIQVIGNGDYGYRVYESERDITPPSQTLFSVDEVNEFLNSHLADKLRNEGSSTVPSWADGPSNWKVYATQGGEDYREILFKAPERIGVFDKDQVHFPNEKNVLFHVRGADFKTVDGDKTFLIDEVQSDWHIKGKQGAYDTPENQQKSDRLSAEIDKATDEISVLYPDALNEFDDNADEIIKAIQSSAVFSEYSTVYNAIQSADMYRLAEGISHDIDIFDAVKDAIKDKAPKFGRFVELFRHKFEANQEYGALQKRVPNAPLKDSYPATALRALIRESVDDGLDSISWATGDMQAARYDEKYRKMYELIYDKALVKEAERLAKKHGGTVGKTKIKNDEGELIEVWELKFSPKLKHEAKYKGFPLFQTLGAGAVGTMAAGENDNAE